LYKKFFLVRRFYFSLRHLLAIHFNFIAVLKL